MADVSAFAMRLNLSRLRRDVHRLFRGRSLDVHEVAVRQWTLCPAEHGLVPPALYIPGSLERITGLPVWGNWDDETALILGQRIDHAPAIAYEIHDAHVCGPVVYCGAAKSHVGHGAERWLRGQSGSRQHRREASLVSSHGGSHYFGMFLWADVPQALWVDDASQRIWMRTQSYAHELGYRRLLGMESSGPVTDAFIDRLTVFSDFGQNASKEVRYRLLRERLRRSIGCQPQTPRPYGIYIRRGGAGESRTLSNEAEVEATLTRRGFRVIDPDALSAEELALQSLDASVVVSIEGSQLSHAIYSAADHATFVVLQPPYRFSMTYKGFTDRMGMRFGFLVGCSSNTGFSISIDELQSLLDRIA